MGSDTQVDLGVRQATLHPTAHSYGRSPVSSAPTIHSALCVARYSSTAREGHDGVAPGLRRRGFLIQIIDVILRWRHGRRRARRCCTIPMRGLP